MAELDHLRGVVEVLSFVPRVERRDTVYSGMESCGEIR